MSDDRPHQRALIRVAGVSYDAVVYWARNSQGEASVVIALPMGDDAGMEAIMEATGAEGTPPDMLDWLVARIGTLGAEVLPHPGPSRVVRVN